jgi:hypothetical protein
MNISFSNPLIYAEKRQNANTYYWATALFLAEASATFLGVRRLVYISQSLILLGPVDICK